MDKKLERIISTAGGNLESNLKIEGDKVYWSDMDGGYYFTIVGSNIKTLTGTTISEISAYPNPLDINGFISNTNYFKVIDNNGLNVTNLCTFTKVSGNFTFQKLNEYVWVTATGDGEGSILVQYLTTTVKPPININDKEIKPTPTIPINTTIIVNTSNITTSIFLSPTGTTIDNPYLTGYTYTTLTGATEGDVISACTWLTGPWTWQDNNYSLLIGKSFPLIIPSGYQYPALTEYIIESGTTIDTGFTWLDYHTGSDQYSNHGDYWYEFWIQTGTTSTSGSTGTTSYWTTGYTWGMSGLTAKDPIYGENSVSNSYVYQDTYDQIMFAGSFHCWVDYSTPSISTNSVWYASGATGIEVNSGFTALTLPVIVTNQTGETIYTGITVSLESGSTSINFIHNPWFGDLIVYSINNQPIENGTYVFKFTHISGAVAYYTLIMQ